MKIYLNSEGVRIIVAKKNRSLSWFAKQVGISRGYVSVLLAQRKSPQPKVRRKIQKTLNGHKWDDLFIICSVTSITIERGGNE